MTQTGTNDGDIEAAGAVLFRRNASGAAAIEICLIHRPRYDDWSFPKGKLKPNESPQHAAVREVEEETGTPIRLLSFLSTITYPINDDGSEGTQSKRSHPTRRKHVSYWVAEQISHAASVRRAVAFAALILPTPEETDEVVWLIPAEAHKKLTYASDKKILKSFIEDIGRQRPEQSGTVILLRHAKAEERKHWDGTEENRPITPRGAQDAYAITRELACFAPDILISSPWMSCLETLGPYAHLAHHRIIEDDSLTEDAFAMSPQETAEAIINHLGKTATTHTTAVICMHQPVLVGVFKELREFAISHEVSDALPNNPPFLPTACAIVLTVTLEPHTQKPVITHIQRLKPLAY